MGFKNIIIIIKNHRYLLPLIQIKILIYRTSFQNAMIMMISSTNKIETKNLCFKLITQIREMIIMTSSTIKIETKIQTSLKLQNVKEFEKAVLNLTVLYDMEDDIQHPKYYEKKYVIRSLQLLHLLSTNKFKKFHRLLSVIPEKHQQQKYIQYVIKLENSFNIGNYNQVLKHAKSPPLKQMSFFLQHVNETIRFQMAKSIEISFDSLNLQDALELFHFNDMKELNKFINHFSGISFSLEKQDSDFFQKLGNSLSQSQRLWVIKGKKVEFQQIEEQKRSIDSLETIKNLFNYTRELEQII